MRHSWKNNWTGRDQIPQQTTEVVQKCEYDAPPMCNGIVHAPLHQKCCTQQQIDKLESSQSPHTSAKAMLFARWQHHLRFCSGFPYAPLKAMVTKISNSFRITFKIESLVAFAIPDICSKFQKDPSITFRVILLTDRQRDKETNKVWQKHYLLG